MNNLTQTLSGIFRTQNLATMLLTACCFLLTGYSYSQTPQQLNYQGVARDNAGVELTTQNIGLRITLHSGSAGGPTVYQETHAATTNQFGLFNIAIGSGGVISGTFNTIAWGSNTYYVQVEMDASGGTSYQNMGTSQLLSVPYALYAETANTSADNQWLESGIDIRNSNIGNVGINTSTPEGKLHIVGDDVVSQLIVDASSAQNNGSPLIMLRKNDGTQVLSIHSDHAFNTFVGLNTGTENNAAGGGTFNTFIGRNSGSFNSTGGQNTGVGVTSLYANTFGYANTAIGMWSMSTNTTGNNNTAVGLQSLYSNSNAHDNTAVGVAALYSNNTGGANTAMGKDALYTNTQGLFNVAVGHSALYNNSTANWNVAVGRGTLYYNAAGTDNTVMGDNAGYGAPGTDFTNCTFIGSTSGPQVSRTNVTMLGAYITNGQCTGNNQVLLGNTSVVDLRAQQNGITTYSDARFKTAVSADVKGLDFITKLKPVTYNQNPEVLHQIWGTPDSLLKKIDHSEIKKQRFIGFLAQDVEKAAAESGFDFPGIDVPRNDKEVYALRYVDFIMPMVKAIQELNTEKDKQILALQQQIDELKSKVK